MPENRCQIQTYLLPSGSVSGVLCGRFLHLPMSTERISSEKLFSTYRAVLMGLAMLGIMLHHFDKLEGMHYTFFPFDFAGPAILWWGVEIFFFLSGLGCYHSCCKSGTWVFYKRRFLRILPAAFIAGIGKLCIMQAPLQFFDIRYLLGINLWFIEAYFVYILLLPPLIRVLNARNCIRVPLLCLLSVVLMFAVDMAGNVLPSGWVCRFHEMITRSPAFILGAVWAYLYSRKRDILSKVAWPLQLVLMAAGAGAYFYLLEGPPQFHRGPINIIVILALMIPFVTYWLACLISILARYRFFRPIQTCLSWMGTLSLELYLVHEFIFARFEATSLSHLQPVWFLLLLFSISFLAAWLLHVCAGRLIMLIKEFSSRREKQA